MSLKYTHSIRFSHREYNAAAPAPNNLECWVFARCEALNGMIGHCKPRPAHELPPEILRMDTQEALAHPYMAQLISEANANLSKRISELIEASNECE